MSVALVDYGLGNLGSVANMVKRVGATTERVSTPEQVLASERLLLPGIGAFDTGMRLLREQGLVPAIREFAASGRPVFGICLGMQLLPDGSEEGQEPGLGLIPGGSRRFPDREGLRVPHMGWNLVSLPRADALTADLPEDRRFYFVHSYRVVPEDETDTIGLTEYGEVFASMIRRGNVMGAQFHPEKSHSFGMQLLKNFVSL